jgi:hypothetical protein
MVNVLKRLVIRSGNVKLKTLVLTSGLMSFPTGRDWYTYHNDPQIGIANVGF